MNGMRGFEGVCITRVMGGKRLSLLIYVIFVKGILTGNACY